MPGSPSAFETDFGWVIAEETATNALNFSIASHHTTVSTGDEIVTLMFLGSWKTIRWLLQTFDWRKSSSRTLQAMPLSLKWWSLHCSSSKKDTCSTYWWITVPSSKNVSIARKILSLQESVPWVVSSDGWVHVFQENHAELVPMADLEKPTNKVFYLPLQVVCKESSSTTKLCAVFDASAASSSGMSLNNTRLVGPTGSLITC